MSAEELRELYRKVPDSPRSRVDEYTISWIHISVQTLIRREARERCGGSGVEIRVLGDKRNMVGLRESKLGVGSTRLGEVEHPKNPVTNGKLGALWPNLNHLTRDVPSEHDGSVFTKEPGQYSLGRARLHIDRIDSDRFDSYDNLAGARFRAR